MAEMFTKAAAYEQLMGRWSRQLAPLFLDFSGIRDGESVLDVGCGTGSLTCALTEQIPHAKLVGIDVSQAAIDYCRDRYAGRRVAFDCGDAMRLPYRDQAFDHSLSLLVFQFIPDPTKAATEMHRVTRPRGVVAACTWDSRALEMAATFWEEACRLDPAAESLGERPQKCRSPGELEALWHGAGLANVEESALEFETAFANFDDYWHPFIQGVGPYGVYTDRLSEESRVALREQLRKRIMQGRSDGPFAMRARALAVRGTVPG